jgi:hypothetical protein
MENVFPGLNEPDETQGHGNLRRGHERDASSLFFNDDTDGEKITNSRKSSLKQAA